MAITTPWSAEITRHQDKRDITVSGDGAPTPDGGHVRLHLGANVDPAKRQFIQGSIERLLRWTLNHLYQFTVAGSTQYVSAPWDNVTDGTIERDGTAPTTDDVIALGISGSFWTANPIGGNTARQGSHILEESVKQLAAYLLEISKDN